MFEGQQYYLIKSNLDPIYNIYIPILENHVILLGVSSLIVAELGCSAYACKSQHNTSSCNKLKI